jgi:nucleoside-diphosphate-sugar epimerase
VFLTGATGFIGSFLVPELINAGHHVVGLSRSAAGAEALTRAGAEVFAGDVNDLDRVRTASAAGHLRLPPDTLARRNATGPGWQTRMAEALSKVV